METKNTDNQGRNLEAVKSHFDALAAAATLGRIASAEGFAELVKNHPLPDWTEVKEVKVLRAGSDRFVAVPARDRVTAANFTVIDLEKGEVVVPRLHRSEVREWLWKASLR